MDKLEFKIKTLESIDKLFDQVEEMEQKRNQLNDSLKHKYDQEVDALKKRRAEMKEKLNEYENATLESQEKLKETLSASMKHYKAGFDELSKLFK
ncbi:MAG: hypothetical protein PF694_06690 [Bacteroidetes bacterium]|jgi:uncharacterized coiled-coil DUF342 family protein|nr:hypothetical protein [Bacteroidota bacterium]